MATPEMYHEGSRSLQDQFDSRRIADRLVQVTVHDAFTQDDRDFMARCAMFFLATADAEGWAGLLVQRGRAGLRPGAR